MGLISIEGIKVFAHHGCYKEEQKIGCNFVVDIYIEGAIEKSAITDDIKDTINYQKVYLYVLEEMKIRSSLLENVAQRIINRLINNFDGIKCLKVRVTKLNPAMGGHVDKVSVMLEMKNEKSNKFE